MKQVVVEDVDGYIASLPEGRRAVLLAVRDAIRTRMPDGYVEGLSYGMLAWSVPLSRSPVTYNGYPLCYVALAAQKHYYVIHLMGVYGSDESLQRLRDAFARAGSKLDMGKACVRFTSLDGFPLDAIGDSIASVTMDEYIAIYERSRLQTKAGQKQAAKARTRRR
ncbi:MAG: DUF1801 domain-containing protein [bacterium]